MAMTRKQQRFLMETLPSYILREQGRGFAMSHWTIEKLTPGLVLDLDQVKRAVPSCGTVACIGGSSQVLLAASGVGLVGLSRRLGITTAECSGLFYNWESIYADPECGCAWPARFIGRYRTASTPFKKAQIAAELCRLVGQTKGKCLHLKGKQ